MSNSILLIIPVVLGFFSLQFYYWRRLKEDYASSLLFSSSSFLAFFVLLGVLIGYLVSRFVPNTRIFHSQNAWFWTGLVGFFVGSYFSYRKFNIKFYEGFEAGGVGLVLTLFYLNLFYGLIYSHIWDLFAAFVLLLLFVVFYFFESRYRQFSWYRSGRVGFSGFAIFIVYFLFRVISNFFEPTAFSLVGRVDIVLSALLAFLLMFSLYNLGEE